MQIDYRLLDNKTNYIASTSQTFEVFFAGDTTVAGGKILTPNWSKFGTRLGAGGSQWAINLSEVLLKEVHCLGDGKGEKNPYAVCMFPLCLNGFP